MTLSTIPKLAIMGSLKLARMPADGVLRLAGDSRSATSIKLALDRTEAFVRGVTGGLFSDDTLRYDAERRSEAAAERERALRLRSQAEARSTEADDKVSQRHEEADRRRKQAESSADRKRGQAKQRKDTKKSKAAKDADRRRDAAKRAAKRKQQEIDDRAKSTRLESAETKAEAHDEKEVALRAADEADRLRSEATAAKERRRSDG